jgi:surface antigen
MRAVGTGSKGWLLGSVLLLSCTVAAVNTEAAQRNHSSHGHARIAPSVSLHAHAIGGHMRLTSGARFSHAMHLSGRRYALHPYAMHFYGISCVPYAREASGIEVAGNAWQWWDNAEGRYARGDAPETGSVLNFRANGRMRLGHVAVVTHVVNAREVMVDHANWPGASGRGGVSHDVAVVDVSEANNWSAVRVEMGRGGEFGSIYPTYGFIYNRPDNGLITASLSRPAPLTEMNRVPADLRPAAERPWHTIEEVAEAPAAPRRAHGHGIDLRLTATPSGLGQ